MRTERIIGEKQNKTPSYLTTNFVGIPTPRVLIETIEKFDQIVENTLGGGRVLGGRTRALVDRRGQIRGENDRNALEEFVDDDTVTGRVAHDELLVDGHELDENRIDDFFFANLERIRRRWRVLRRGLEWCGGGLG